MKTQLLLFLLFAISFVKAQINVNEGFESGFPVGWTQENTDGVVTYSSSCGGFKSVKANYYANLYAIIYTSSYVSNGEAINLSFVARKQIGAFYGYEYLYYQVNGTGAWNQIANVYSDFSTCTPVNATIAAGVIPNGSTVKFRMQVNSASSSNVNYVYFDNFNAVQQPAQVPQAVAEYNFDNTYNNVDGNLPFNSTLATSFVNNRAGESQKALRVDQSNTVCMATITNLPTGNNSRTVSLWYKNDFFASGTPVIFVYGTTANNQYFGNYINTAGNMFLWSFITDFNFGGNYSPNIWRHLVMTHDEFNVKIYVDGNYIGQQTTTLNTGNTIGFRIGGIDGAVLYDDLKIYNYALNQAEVTSLYTNNTLSSENFNSKNLEVALYPNPIKDVLNIETALELQSVEIYNIQGQKVLSSNQKQINVADLATGMYIVRIQDENNAVETKKIIKQ